jgi:hypothetical protein
MKIAINALLVFCLATSLLSCKKEKGAVDSETIDVEKSIRTNRFGIHPLSDYASEIRYVRLDMNDNSLITDNIKRIHLEDRRLFVHDLDPFLKVFDAHTGRFLYNIGGRGQGPGELAHLTFADIDIQNQRILLTQYRLTNEFDFEGNFIGRIEHPFVNDEETCYNIVILDKNLFAANIFSRKDVQENAVVLFNRDGEILNTLKSYNDPIHHPTIFTWGPTEQGGIFYRTANDISFYRQVTDTIYSFNRTSKNFEARYPIYFGKHKPPHDRRDPSAVSPHQIHIKLGDQMRDNNMIAEYSKFIFFDFAMFRYAPEPFEDSFLFSGQVFNRTNQDVYGIFDKQNSQLKLLLHPIPALRGLKNDLDGGIPFWPKSISSNGEMVDWRQAYKFIEHAEKLSDPDESFLNILQSIDEDDNPIVIIATSSKQTIT